MTRLVAACVQDATAMSVRYALRCLRQNPGFTLVAALTLALGIGANTIVFSAISAILLRPLPVDRPHQLAFLYNALKSSMPSHSYPNYRDLRDLNDIFSGLIAYRFSPISLSRRDGGNARVWGYLATGNYFDVLGVQAVLGRTFTPADDLRPGAHPVAILSYGCWQRRFGADPRIAGQTAKLNGMDYTILGVAPPGFFGTELFFTPELWVPMMMQPQIEPGNPWLERRGTHNIFVLGRLKPGMTIPQAEASLDALVAQLAREHAWVNEGIRLRLSPPGLAGNTLRTPVMGFASILMALAGLVLLVACTNLAGLLLARAADRRRETAVRLALGASRSELASLFLTESLVLSLAGGAAGVLLALWLSDLFFAWQPPVDFPLRAGLPIDARVLAFTFVLSLLTTLLFGLAPALQAARAEVAPTLKENLRRVSLRDLLVASQLAVSVVLLVASVLVVRSLQRALSIPLGFNPRHAVSLSFDLALQGYDEPRGHDFQRRLLARASTLPGVASAAITRSLPLTLDISNNSIYLENTPALPASRRPHAIYYEVSPGYFHTLQTRLVTGRDFDSRDTPDSPRVAIVNQAFVTQFQSPARFRFGSSGPWIEIIGVVEDGKYSSLGESPTPVVFAPLSQSYNATTTLVVRSPLPPDQILPSLRRAVLDLDPTISLYDVGALEDHLRLPLFPARLAASALSVFGALTLLSLPPPASTA